MTALDDIKTAIEKLDSNEFNRLRVWFENHDAARFDEKIARDAKTGKLDRLADQAVADVRKRGG
jgi:hypothetical protein